MVISGHHLVLAVDKVLRLGKRRRRALAAFFGDQGVGLHRALWHDHVLAVELDCDVIGSVGLGVANGQARVRLVRADGVLVAMTHLPNKGVPLRKPSVAISESCRVMVAMVSDGPPDE